MGDSHDLATIKRRLKSWQAYLGKTGQWAELAPKICAELEAEIAVIEKVRGCGNG